MDCSTAEVSMYLRTLGHAIIVKRTTSSIHICTLPISAIIIGGFRVRTGGENVYRKAVLMKYVIEVLCSCVHPLGVPIPSPSDVEQFSKGHTTMSLNTIINTCVFYRGVNESGICLSCQVVKLRCLYVLLCSCHRLVTHFAAVNN